MGQKYEENCGLWVLNEIHPENLKKIVGAIWELLAKGGFFSESAMIFFQISKSQKVKCYWREI